MARSLSDNRSEQHMSGVHPKVRGVGLFLTPILKFWHIFPSLTSRPPEGLAKRETVFLIRGLPSSDASVHTKVLQLPPQSRMSTLLGPSSRCPNSLMPNAEWARSSLTDPGRGVHLKIGLQIWEAYWGGFCFWDPPSGASSPVAALARSTHNAIDKPSSKMHISLRSHYNRSSLIFIATLFCFPGVFYKFWLLKAPIFKFIIFD